VFNLAGKGALVTGATGGLGAAMARTLHGAGADVVISGTRAEKLEELAAELKERVHVVPCNLADRAAVAKLAGEAETKLGHLDILVNNAGITRDNLFMMMKDDEWDAVIAVNLTSAFTLCRAAVRNMMRRRWGRIINITSVSGIIGNPGQGNYAAAKAGMIGMTKSLAREVASRNITANCIAPGFITTPMTQVLNEKITEEAKKHIPLGRFGSPQDIAAGVLYLASEEASYVTGQTLSINGGLAMP
jgi:3-oxoacyl-[acyl-carrier protein] reductase